MEPTLHCSVEPQTHLEREDQNMSIDMLVFGLLALGLVAAIIYATTGKRSGQRESSNFDMSKEFGRMRDRGSNNFR